MNQKEKDACVYINIYIYVHISRMFLVYVLNTYVLIFLDYFS